MKKILFFMPLLTVLAMTGCSNDDSVNDGPIEPNAEVSYLAVNIVSSNDSNETSRAQGQDAQGNQFENGEGAENQADSGLFLFFDAAGNAAQTPQTVALTWSENTTETPAVEKISNAVLVIAGNTQPAQMLVLLNAPEGTDFTGMSLTDVRALVADYKAEYDATSGDLLPLIITNSTYNDGSKEVCATDITGRTFTSQEEAMNPENVVNVYVERVVAKVKTNAIGDEFTKGAKITIDGNEITLTQTIEGIEIANVAESSYLFKNIAGSGAWSWSGWNDAVNKRSYWATCPETLTYGNQSWNVIDGTEATDAQVFYIQENTSATKSCVLVTATLKADGEPYTFLRWAGNYYDKENFKKQYATLLKNAGFKVQVSESESRTIEPEELEYLTATKDGVDGTHAEAVKAGKIKGYETTVQLTDAAETLTFTRNGEASSAEAVNAFLFEDEQLVWLWEGGKAYYFVNIEHFGDKPFDEGVVRNHVYALNLNSLSGVGVAVFDPEEVIIPEKPSDDLYYLAAQINILKWRIVSQTVDFSF